MQATAIKYNTNLQKCLIISHKKTRLLNGLVQKINLYSLGNGGRGGGGGKRKWIPLRWRTYLCLTYLLLRPNLGNPGGGGGGGNCNVVVLLAASKVTGAASAKSTLVISKVTATIILVNFIMCNN